MPSAWIESDYSLTVDSPNAESVVSAAKFAADRACRLDFNRPGFCLLNLGSALSSKEFRKFHIDLARSLSDVLSARERRKLRVLSAGRFDQQTTTKPHRDGGPDESLLALGYEPSPVESEVRLLDYSHCANDMGITPLEFLERHNPMFTEGARLLVPYSTSVRSFRSSNYQILMINNSAAKFQPSERRWQGVLHTATIVSPNEELRRVVNSTMLEPVEFGLSDVVPQTQLEDFLTTARVRRRGYDNPDRTDDI